MAQQLLDPTYLATGGADLRVNIDDNDMPIVRADVDLNATENTVPGYFSLSVLDPVGVPGGLPVHYTVYGSEDDRQYRATAERQPNEEDLGENDPGPDFQGFDEINSGTLYIPEGQTRVVFPIFPIDDFTPEESLAARYEKVVVEIQPPGEDDLYLLDTLYPETQTAAVRILDNEEIGLKAVIPGNGLNINEGGFNGFRVGLKSQPQKPVDLNFYYNDIRSDNQRDLTFLDIDSVTFDNTNWNQWQTVDVRLFNNLTENRDDLHPRYTDLYYTLGAGTEEPFYNTLKGALNSTGKSTDTEATVIEGTVIELNGEAVPEATVDSDTYSTDGIYGTLTLTSVAEEFLGDFTYALDADNTEQILGDILSSGIEKVFDEFSYTIHPAGSGGSDLEQKVAVEIRILNDTYLSEDNVDEELTGNYGTLTLHNNGTYEYVLEEASLPQEDDWSIYNSFVYVLETPPANDGEAPIQTRYVLNLGVTQDTDADGVNRYAWSNGDSVNSDDGGTPEDTSDDLTIVDDVNINGNVIAAEIENFDFEIPQSTIFKVGRTTLTPVVTAMTLRDKNDIDLEVDGAPLYTNPLFMAMPLNYTGDFIAPGNELPGQYGALILNDDGSYSYDLYRETLAEGVEDYEERIVHDRFTYTLSNRSEKVLQLVTTYDQASDTVTVQADDRSTLFFNGETFTGNIINQIQEPNDLTVTRFGLATASVHPQEQPLDPIVIRDGLSQLLSTLQGNLNNISVPVLGRLGGGGTGDDSGSGSEAPIPDFADRLLAIVESEITKQPRLTTAELEKVFKTALQATLATFGVPIVVLKFDTEKLLLKLSYSYGGVFAQAEAASDWGDPGLGRFQASGELGYKTAIDVVFGIQFRTYQTSGNAGNKWAPSVFIVTTQDKLDSLLTQAGDSKPTKLFPLRTWAGKTVSKNGIIFGDADWFCNFGCTGGGLPQEPDNYFAISDDLQASGKNLGIGWEWKSVPGNGVTSALSFPFVKRNQPQSHAQIVGTVQKEGRGKAKFIEISLVQPSGIGANSSATLTMRAITDPDHLLQGLSNRPLSDQAKNVEEILDWFARNNKKIEFNDREILATSLSKDTATRKISFDVSIKRKTDSSAFGKRSDSYVASVNLKQLVNPPEVPNKGEDIYILPFSTRYTSKNTYTLSCERLNPCRPEQIVFTEKVVGDNTPTASQDFKFPLDRDLTKAFAGGRKSFSDKKDLTYGTIEATATLTGNTVTYTWSYSPKAKDKLLDKLEIVNEEQCTLQEFKKQKCRDNRGYKKIDLKVKPKSSSNEKIDHFQLMDGTLAFSEPEPGKKNSPESNAVSKVSAELFAMSDFVGGITMSVFSAGINQALTAPIADPVNLSNPERNPADAYRELSAKYSDRQKLVKISEDNANETSQAFIVGQFGVLGLAQDGSYSYAFKPEAREAEVEIVYNPLPPETHDEAAAQALFKEFLVSLENPSDEAWGGQPAQPATIEFKGYTIECPAFEDVLNQASCQVSSPYVVMSKSTQEDLKSIGVSSLESAIDQSGEITGWETSPSLTNRTTLANLKTTVQAGTDSGSISGLTQLRDEFFIASNQEPGYDRLVFTYGADDSLTPTFGDNLSNSRTDFTKRGDAWYGTELYLTSGASPIEAGPGKIKPMANARVFVDLALVSEPKNGADPGIISLSLTDTNIKDARAQFTLGGEAALYAQVNMGFGFATGDESDAEQNAELGYDIPVPNLSTKLGLVAHYGYTSNFSTYSAYGGEVVFGVYDLGLDLGSFISERLAGPLGNFSNLLEPAKPIINALNTDTKIFAELGLVSDFDQNGDGKVTILEIPTPFLEAGSNSTYSRMLATIQRVLALLGKLLDLYQVVVDLGRELSGFKALDEQVVSSDGYMVAPEDIRINPWQSDSGFSGAISKYLVPYVDNFGHVILGSQLSYQYGKSHRSQVSQASLKEVKTQLPESETNKNTKNKAVKKVKDSFREMQDLGFISLPLLSNPLELLKLLFGDPANLIMLDLPSFEMDFPIDKVFPIYAFIKGSFEAQLQTGLNAAVGVDTAGLQTVLCGESPIAIWDCSNPDVERNISDPENLLRLINMIYLTDWSRQSYEPGGHTLAWDDFWTGIERYVLGKSVVDKHELSGNAITELGVGAQVGLGAFMEGGIGIGGGFDIIDLCESEFPEPCSSEEGEPEQTYDGKIRVYDFFGTQLGNSSFDEIFSMLFELYASLEIAIKLFETEVFDVNIGRFKLFEFSLDGATFIDTGISKSGNLLVGSTVFFDANDNRLPDPGEPMTFTDSQGRAALHVPYKFFDKNGDRIIDEQDGRIVMLDGVDVKTGLPQLDPLVVVPQAKMVSPFTTLVTALVDKGLSVAQAEDRVKTTFALPADLDLLQQNVAQVQLGEVVQTNAFKRAQKMLELLLRVSAVGEGATTMERRQMALHRLAHEMADSPSYLDFSLY